MAVHEIIFDHDFYADENPDSNAINMATINQALDILYKAGGDVVVSNDMLSYKTTITIEFPPDTPWLEEIKDTNAGAYMIPEVQEIRYNGPATIVFWKDGTKTVVKMQPGELCYDPDKAFAMAVCKKLFGNKFNRHLTEAQKAFKKCYEEECEKECIRFDNLITMVKNMFSPSANSDSEDKKED